MGRFVLRLFGWRFEGEPPPRKCVIVAAPHTSNWDFVFLLAAAYSIGIKVHWLGKKELFRQPFKAIMRGFGGIPVYRGERRNMVDDMADRFAAASDLALTVPPSGTRGKTDYWRSGFYWIAHGAQVHVVCGYLDYAKREAGLGLRFIPQGRPAEEMEAVRDFYRDIQGKYPGNASRVRLREEDE